MSQEGTTLLEAYSVSALQCEPSSSLCEAARVRADVSQSPCRSMYTIPIPGSRYGGRKTGDGGRAPPLSVSPA